MFNLGRLADRAGRTDEAKTWYQHAFEAGHITAALELGILCQKEGQLDQAEQWYRRGAEVGDPKAAGRTAVARQWWQRASAAGHIGALTSLAFLETETGQSKKQKGDWLRKPST